MEKDENTSEQWSWMVLVVLLPPVCSWQWGRPQVTLLAWGKHFLFLLFPEFLIGIVSFKNEIKWHISFRLIFMCCLNIYLLGAFLKERIYFHVHVGVALKKILIFHSHAITMCQMCINQMLLENGFRVFMFCLWTLFSRRGNFLGPLHRFAQHLMPGIG